MHTVTSEQEYFSSLKMGITTVSLARFIMCAFSQIWNLDSRKDTKKGDYLEREEEKNRGGRAEMR